MHKYTLTYIHNTKRINNIIYLLVMYRTQKLSYNCAYYALSYEIIFIVITLKCSKSLESITYEGRVFQSLMVDGEKKSADMCLFLWSVG